jgi:hypothetical protein
VNTGQYISAGGHFGLIAYVMFGGMFFLPSDSEPVQVQEVSMISEAEFAALTRVNTAPDVPDVAPQITAPAQEAPAPSAPEAAPSESAPTAQPQAPSEPEVSLEDSGAGLPDIPDQAPTPRPVPRVAPQAVVNPEQTPDIAEQVTPEISDDAEKPAEEQVEEVEPAAPQEAVTEIVTEAERPSGLSTSPRPKSRPASVVAATKKAQEAAEAAANERQADANAAANAAADAASALIAEAVSDTPAAPERPIGPPLTGGEREGLRVAVSQCWNTGSMSTEAQRTKVTVAMNMNQDGTPQTGSIKLIGSTGGSSASAEQAFQTARRAIIICGKKGFPLPQDKFSQWQSIEMTFDPEQMRFK